VELPSRNREPLSRSSVFLGLYGGLAAIAFVVGAVRGDLDLYRLPHATTWRMVASPFIGVAVGLAIVFVSRLSVHRFDWARRLHRDFRGVLGTLSAWDILILAFASSVGEELFFRGALLPWLGLVGSSVVFALLHIGPGVRFLPWTLSALLAGFAFGGLTLGIGDLGAAITAHFTVNFMNLHYIVRVELPAE
jgi:uncharacterized protein